MIQVGFRSVRLSVHTTMSVFGRSGRVVDRSFRDTFGVVKDDVDGVGLWRINKRWINLRSEVAIQSGSAYMDIGFGAEQEAKCDVSLAILWKRLEQSRLTQR